MNKARLYLLDPANNPTIITNGNFDGSLNGWSQTSSPGWSYDSGAALARWNATSKLFQPITLVYGESYTVTFFMTYSGTFWKPGGTLTMVVNGNSFDYTDGGLKTETFLYSGGAVEISFNQSFLYRGRVSSVAIKPVNPEVDVYNEIHLADDEFINLSFAIADIEDITKRGTTFSKSVTVPSTSHNDNVLNHLYDLDVENDDRYLYKKIPALLYYGDAQILNGICEITKVQTVHANNQARYEIVLRSNVKTFADVISSKYITGNDVSDDDIDFSQYDHIFTINNIQKTWYNPSYPNKPTQLYGSGYYYPAINYANKQSNTDWNFEQLRPTIYVKELFDKIVSDAGFTYDSTFINSTYFKSLVLPFTGRIRTSEDELEQRKFKAGLGADIVSQSQSNPVLLHSTFSANANKVYTPFINDDNQPAPLDFFDNGNNYNAPSSAYVVPAKGMYNFDFTAIGIPILFGAKTLAAAYYYPKSVDSGLKRMELTVRIRRLRAGKIDTIASKVHIIPLPSKFFNPKTYTANVGQFKSFLPTQTFDVACNGQQFQQGDVIFVDFALNNKLAKWKAGNGKDVSQESFAGSVDFPRLNPDNSGRPGAVFYNTPLASDGLFIGEQVKMNSMLPTKTKQIDFVNSLITMFNLIVEEDPTDKTNLIIDPRSYYFSSGDTKDWSFKLDRSQEIDIERIPTLIDKNVVFKYQEDKDFYNKDYQEVFQETYGDWEIKNAELTSNDEEIDIIFAPTPGTEIPNTDIIVPQIYDIDDNDKLAAQSYKIRILHRVDIVDYPGTSFTLENYSPNKSIAFHEYQNGIVVATGYMANTIPTASHLDDPYAPTKDLNWGYSKKYYNELYPSTEKLPTWGNLYNDYWRDYIELIMDPNSKMITAQFKLDEQDIYTFRFFDKIQIDGQFYTVNKISDWNPDVLTEVVLIKEKISTVPTSSVAKLADTVEVLDYKNIVYRRKAQPQKEINNTFAQQQSGRRTYTTAVPTSRSMYDINDEQPYLASGTTWNDYSGTTAYTVTVTGQTTVEPTIVTPESRGFVTGVNNDINSRNFFVAGNDNIYSGTSYTTMIVGNTNGIGTNVTNGVIIGDSNEIAGGLSNVNILGGTGTTVQLSDTLVLGNRNILTRTAIEPIVDVIAAPNLDTKQINPFNRLKQIQILAGGNVAQGVRPLRSENTIFVVDSTTSATIRYKSYTTQGFDANGDPIAITE